ncbi:hypothetical protein F5X98DRAFT_201462 [Xylaria grammica]|nr:hypothetical protein F5X98DRAFT_201462 [Xylaria grammica]
MVAGVCGRRTVCMSVVLIVGCYDLTAVQLIADISYHKQSRLVRLPAFHTGESKAGNNTHNSYAYCCGLYEEESS